MKGKGNFIRGSKVHFSKALAICKDHLLSWVMFFQPLRTRKWKNGSQQQLPSALCFGLVSFLNSGPFAEEPGPEHTFPSLGAGVAAVLGDAAQKGSRHYPGHINPTVPTYPSQLPAPMVPVQQVNHTNSTQPPNLPRRELCNYSGKPTINSI